MYRECAEHYGFLIAPCAPHTPQHKGKVESDVHYVIGELADRAVVTSQGAMWPLALGRDLALRTGWCRGSAGYVPLWDLAFRHLEDRRLFLSIETRAI